MFEVGVLNLIDSFVVVLSIILIEGSIMGGIELLIKGSGFDFIVGCIIVKIGINYCSVELVMLLEVVCRIFNYDLGFYEVCYFFLSERICLCIVFLILIDKKY